MGKQSHPRLPAVEQPLRAELFSLEQLTRHAQNLAFEHHTTTTKGSNLLLSRLGENEEILKSFNRATLAVNPIRRITPAAEWLLDNFYLIEEQIHLARQHLPRGYSRELPRLVDGASEGLPRVYDIVLELISHVDAQVDIEQLRSFVAAYQTQATLKLGELWAVPIMLRLGLIENLRRVTTRLALARKDRDLADSWVDQLQSMAETNPSHLVVVVAKMAQGDLPLTSSFVGEFSQRLSRQNPVLHLARSWLEQRLGDQGMSIEQLVHQESQNQAAEQISVSHSIGSLRSLSSMDWKEFVESLSAVEQVLHDDPPGIYRSMDFSTRDRYRHSVETIARHCPLSETEVAQKAIELAVENVETKGRERRASHVGFYLINKGRRKLERASGMRRPWQTYLERSIHSFPLLFYAGAILLLTALATGAFVHDLLPYGLRRWELIAAVLVFVICSSQLAVALVNWLATFSVKPRLLPRLDFSNGIPPDCRTMVVVPTMLTSQAEVDRLIEILEIHHLANRGQNLHFALLTDFRDAEEEIRPDDESLLERARAGVEMLAKKYSTDRTDIFFLLHRPRRWNPRENLWMGYERKRGKLTEFNALLRGGPRERFSEIVGDTSILPGIKYVITLDTDTHLPRDTARELVGTMAHPLNHPKFDPSRGVVTEGYSIMQPRVGVSLPSARRSWFVRLFAGDAGIDPYTRAVSDVYQDIFQEGSFIGKGIYEVDAFEQALAGRFPDNAVLSHDLIESCHARSALVSDVEFYEDHPSRYNAEIARRHRWIRGDWQIARWLLPWVPKKGGRGGNPLSALSLWKIFDNLRRSLVPSALLILLLGSWMFLPQLGGLGSLVVFLIITLPGLLPTLVEVAQKPSELPWSLHFRALSGAAGRQLGQIFLTLAFLPHDAYMSIDAITRTLFRLLFTRKRLLEWQTSSDAERTARADLLGFYGTMWIAPFIALASGVFLALRQPDQLFLALPILAIWLAAPWMAWLISQPIDAPALDLTDEQLTFLNRVARKTWYFFETFVNAQENWLPPDNYQEQPAPVVASRTSPTNIGLSLLANLAATDFGYLPVGAMMQRTQSTLATMDRLERYRGHFYNWYDTRTLQPLLPLYVSSVDSGNLAGHLMTLASGLRQYCDEKIYSPIIFSGLRDTVNLVRSLAGKNSELAQLDAELAKAPVTIRAALVSMERITARAHQMALSLESADGELRSWSQILKRNCDDHLEELRFLAPWVDLKSPIPPPGRRRAGAVAAESDPGSLASSRLEEQLERLDRGHTLRELSTLDQAICPVIDEALQELGTDPAQKAERKRLAELARGIREASAHACQRILSLETLARQSDQFAEMDFTFLFDPARELFSIGFNATEFRRDASFYDLLASEARLCSYVAVAQGQVSEDHWFSMGRLLVASLGEPILVSWSGSMFEYLMPMLVMPAYDNTLLDHTCKAAVQQQIEYGKSRGVPWGISESGYNRTDTHLNYQYRAFGVPGLGLKRGLAEDLVIAPYATAMALMVFPRKACENLQRLADDEREGAYGFYEAIDYTPSRLPPGQESATIFSYMAHHQGMALLSLAYVLRNRPMQRRFLACRAFKAADLLLQERVPKTAANVLSEDLEMDEARSPSNELESVMRVFTNPTSRTPEVHLLSNGRYHVVVSSAGGGYSRWNELAVTRWREDATRDCWGTFIYLRDIATGEFWSTAFQPALCTTKNYEAIFTQGRAEFRQRQSGLEVHTQISVSPEDDVELRRVTITNHSNMERVIELTSYAEVVLAPAAADSAHPAFSNLFVQTEFAHLSAILCTRRARSETEKPPWLLHVMVGQGGRQGKISCETDRSRFVGRGGSLVRPAALQKISPLSNTVGSVLDPIVSLRRLVTLGPNETTIIDFVLGMTGSREASLALVEKYQNSRMADRAFDLAWTHSQVTLRHLNCTEGEAQLYGRLASALIYADPARRAHP
ncbi:MAG: glucoamylase family protein, partial [Verrucomicrobiota bacterium]